MKFATNIVAALVLFAVPNFTSTKVEPSITSFERPVPDWSYKKLESHSTHIVLAIPTEIREADENDRLRRPPGNAERYKGVITKFKILSAIKGSVDEPELTVGHFLEIAVNGMYVGNGPQFVSFRPFLNEKPDYKTEYEPVLVLFLKKNPSRSAKHPYEFVTVKTDPLYSVRKLQRLKDQDGHWPDDF